LHCGGSLESSHHPLHGICTNRNSIGIEICTHYNGTSWEFTDKAVTAAVELTKYLMTKFSVPADHVCRHWDITGKFCPRVPGWGAVGGSSEWEKFLKRVKGQTETKKTEKAKDLIPDAVTARAIHFFYPGFSRRESPYDYDGAGCVWHDQNKHTLVFDAYVKNSRAANSLISYIKKNELHTIDYVVLSHAHSDHGGGIIQMMDDKEITIKNFLCYDPESLRLAGDGSANARSAKADKNYLKGIISKAKQKDIKVKYLKTGDVIECGEMHFTAFRDQPTKFTEYDTGEAYAYLNDGSINLYEKNTCFHMTGDGGGKAASKYYGAKEVVVESEHHGNGGGQSTATEYKSKGAKLAIECNNEKGGPGSCEFTWYGARRLTQAGIEVWMEDTDIYGIAKAGKLTVTQGDKKRVFSVPFCAVLYRVRKTWADSASQLGAYSALANAKDCADKAGSAYGVFDANGKEVYRPAAPVKTKTDSEAFIEKIGALAKKDMEKHGICAAITTAQAILESGWGKSELTVNANNLFGMKKNLSGNTWAGSTWDGKSVYTKKTGEVYNGKRVTVTADFRKYPSVAASIGDHSAYLAGAMNGTKKRYAGLVGCTDYKKAAQIIKDGGYATASDYVQKLCKIVEQYGLTKYNTDYKPEKKTEEKKKEEKKEEKKETKKKEEKKETGVPFTVKVKTTMNIRTGAGLNFPARAQCKPGIYTIVQVSGDWGKLKSGAGWIYIVNKNWVERTK
jgi:hypothetical protein